MKFDLSSSFDVMMDNTQVYIARNIKKQPEMFTNSTPKTTSANMDSFQKSSSIFNEGQFNISRTKGFLGYNISKLSGLSKAVKQVMLEYKLENEKNAKLEGYTPIDELFAQHSEISDEFIVSVLQLSETESKPIYATQMDDLKWGMLINLGKEIGMNDKDGLTEISQQDLKIYYDIKYHNNQEAFEKLGRYDQNGDIVKQYKKAEDVWKDIFLVDSNGNFLKDKTGRLIRNNEFTYTTSVQVDDSVSFNDLSWRMYDWEDNEHDKLKICYYSAGDIMNLTASIIDANDTVFTYLTDYDALRLPNNIHQYEIDIKSARNDAERIFIYKKALVVDYDFLLRDIKGYGSLSYSGQKAVYNEKLDNSKWVTFKPFQQGSFVYEANKIRKDDYKYIQYVNISS